MTYDSDVGWVAQPQEYWYSRLIAEARILKPNFNWNVGSNNSIEKENEAAYYASWDLLVATYKSNLVSEYDAMNIKIQSYNGKAVAGLMRAFLLVPYVKQCVIIRATEIKPECYLFLEVVNANGNVMDFTELTEDQKIELFDVSAETQAITRPRDIYVDAVNPVNFIQGKGMIQEDFVVKSVDATINQIRSTILPKIKIRVLVIEQYTDSVHQITETVAIKKAFLETFDRIQKAGVDLRKINYACSIKNGRDYMYDFNFFDATDENALIDMNEKTVEEFEYFVRPEEGMLEVDFRKKDGITPIL